MGSGSSGNARTKAHIARAAHPIEQTQIIELSLRAQERFVDSLLNPVSPNAALKRARKAHAKLMARIL